MTRCGYKSKSAAHLGPTKHLEVKVNDVAGMQVSHATRDICSRLQDREVVDRPGGIGVGNWVWDRGGGGGGIEGGAAVQPECARLQGVTKVTPVAELEDELHLWGGREEGRGVTKGLGVGGTQAGCRVGNGRRSGEGGGMLEGIHG